MNSEKTFEFPTSEMIVGNFLTTNGMMERAECPGLVQVDPISLSGDDIIIFPPK
jgi:hypothetical protein